MCLKLEDSKQHKENKMTNLWFGVTVFCSTNKSCKKDERRVVI